MSNFPSANMRLPIWQDVDVLVIGSTTAAVSAAISAREEGARVAVVSDEVYFGSDLAGALRLWSDELDLRDPLLAGAFAACSEAPARPVALKRSLEQALLKAEIPFLYGVRPVGVLESEGGETRGVIVAARTALFGITCRAVIDATSQGTLLRLAGISIPEQTAAPELAWRVLADRALSNWPGQARRLTPDYSQTLKDGPKTYQAYELEVPTEVLGKDPKAFDHLVRASLVDEAVWVTADTMIERSSRAAQTKSLEDSEFEVRANVWSVQPETLGFLGAPKPDETILRGRRAGVLAAKSVVRRAHAVPGVLRMRSTEGEARSYGFTPAFLRDSGAAIEIQSLHFPEWEAYEVLVAGGGTGGAPAAIAAARSGVRTLCLEASHGFGGVGTIGMISSYWFGNKVGFTAELNDLVSEFDALSRAKKGNMWHPWVKSGLYHRLLRDAGGVGWLGSYVCGVHMEGNRPTGVLVSTPYGCGFVRAERFVDATGNADMAAAAGASCRLMDSRHAAVQGTGISPRVHPGVLHQNADHTFIEENDPVGITCAHVQAREKYPNDFETAPFVNSRERRQIHGEMEVSPLDILAGRTFPDTLFTAKSNFDTHGFIIHPVFMVVPPDHGALHAHVPLRAMLPKGIEGILVTGLGMSAHRDALPVIRMQADVQNQGYSAGLLAAQCARSGEAFRAVDVKAFQQKLVATGILNEATAADEDSFPMSEKAVAIAAEGELASAKEVAVLFAHPERAVAPLKVRMLNDPDLEKRRTAALILGLMGESVAGPVLVEWVSSAEWDEGWNYRGMGQFGQSMSRLDAAIIALGRTGSPEATAVLAKLAGKLGPNAEFSHCRALALAAMCLRTSGLATALRRLLELPGFTGHAFLTELDILADNDPDPTSTVSRNLALRELYVARGLFLSEDAEGVGLRILEQYTGDLRGHFARHARAVLERGLEEEGLMLA